MVFFSLEVMPLCFYGTGTGISWREGMLVEVGKGISHPNFQQVLELLLAKGEYLAFAPDTEETRRMINLMSMKFPLLKVPIFIYWQCGCVCVFRFHCYSCLSFMGQSKVAPSCKTFFVSSSYFFPFVLFIIMHCVCV